jgi:SAM-dependent methyltransferase
MSELTDPTYLVGEQYKDATNLNARIQLHQRYSTNKYDWQRWVFDHLSIPQNGRILEIGCGPGELWHRNRERIPEHWDITLSDLSPGMLREAQHNLQGIPGRFAFRQMDAQSIPFDDEYFDAVIANHMLYHVPDRAKALSEIRRVLRSDGRFYAATNGLKHMSELMEIVNRFDADTRTLWGDTSPLPFRLENGSTELARWFSHVTVHRYENALTVTEADPLVSYLLSTSFAIALSGEKITLLREFVQRELTTNGAIHITKETGLFEAF